MIILTGASGGLGRDLIGLLAEMDDVIGLYNKNEPPASGNSRITYEKLNLRDGAEIETLIKKRVNQLSKITLVHGAANKIDGLAIKYEEDAWDSVMDVNLKGNFILTKMLLQRMVDEKWGRIINLSSTGGMRGDSGTLAYSASKTALLGMSRVLAKEYGRFNITSNILALGYFKSGMIEALGEELRNELRREIPSMKFGDVKNIAYAIDFLIKSDYTNGAVIHIDGGI